MNIPLLDLKAQYAGIKERILDATSEVLESQVYIGGPKVEELERQIAAKHNCKHGIGVSSGTDALLNALMALDIGPGDEVITTPYTFFATVGCIHRVGAKPVFVDIEPDTFNIDAKAIEAKVTSRTKVILPVHLFGQICEMDTILDIARRHQLAVIEDGAQSISATYRSVPCGAFEGSTACCFSFFPSKNLGAAGDGGMIVTNDEALHTKMRLLRGHGAQPKYFHKLVGGNFRLDALQAAILLVKLQFLDEWSERRRQNAEYYSSRFRGTSVTPPTVRPECRSIVNQYVIRVRRRDELMRSLKAAGIATEIYYPLPMHLQECFAYLGYQPGDFPAAERASNESLALPVYPEMTPEALKHVADKVLAFEE